MRSDLIALAIRRSRLGGTWGWQKQPRAGARDVEPRAPCVRATRANKTTSSEREELAALRRENRRLREDVDVLKRATAFFA
ncbi:hypothetical protein GCM10023193_51020 [Planotetraspora kaengkrachanensis]